MMGKNNASIIRSRAKNKSHPPPTQQTRRKRIMTQDEFIKRHKIFSLIHWTLQGNYNMKRNNMHWENEPERFTKKLG